MRTGVGSSGATLTLQNIYVLVCEIGVGKGRRVPNHKASTHRHLPAEIATALGAALRDARQSASMTQEGLAAASGTSVQMVRRLEAGTSNPTLGTLHAIASALGVGLADLLARTGV